MTSGIYQIRNIINNNIYVGSATQLSARKGEHFYLLRRNKHHSKYLQNAYNKYGESNFIFETLITCHPDMLIWYEQPFIDQWNPEYNICKKAGNRFGAKHSKETIEKLRESHLGIKQSEDSKRKRSTDILSLSPEIKKERYNRISTKNRGKKRSQEFCERLSKINKGKKASLETRIKESISAKNRVRKPKREKFLYQKSGFPYVYFIPENGRYRARPKINGKLVGLGTFDTPEEANRKIQEYMIERKKE